MYKFLFGLFFVIILNSFSSAIADENLYDVIELSEVTANDIESPKTVMQAASITEHEKTLVEKLQDIYYAEVTRTDVINPLLKEITTKKFSEESRLEKIHLWSGYNGNFSMFFDNDYTDRYDFNALTTTIDGTLKDNNGYFRLMFNFVPNRSENYFQRIFSDIYVGIDKIPNTKIQIGNFRPSCGVEGRTSGYLLPFFSRAQISRNFGGVRKIGGKIAGDYTLFDYDLGVFSSATDFGTFFPGAEVDAWVNFKPLGLTNGKYGKLKIGSGVQAGRRHYNYFVTGAYVGYEYKKLLLNFEWANANGYNGSEAHIDKNAQGFYTTLRYKLTPKVHALLRFDKFNPDDNLNNNNNYYEYTAGINYYLKGTGLRLILNYVLCKYPQQKDSHRVLIGTQILL